MERSGVFIGLQETSTLWKTMRGREGSCVHMATNDACTAAATHDRGPLLRRFDLNQPNSVSDGCRADICRRVATGVSPIVSQGCSTFIHFHQFGSSSAMTSNVPARRRNISPLYKKSQALVLVLSRSTSHSEMFLYPEPRVMMDESHIIPSDLCCTSSRTSADC